MQWHSYVLSARAHWKTQLLNYISYVQGEDSARVIWWGKVNFLSSPAPVQSSPCFSNCPSYTTIAIELSVFSITVNELRTEIVLKNSLAQVIPFLLSPWELLLAFLKDLYNNSASHWRGGGWLVLTPAAFCGSAEEEPCFCHGSLSQVPDWKSLWFCYPLLY